MKRACGEIAAEALRRANALEERARRRGQRIIAGLLALCVTAAFCAMLYFTEGGAHPPAEYARATLLLGGVDIGGYVLTGVLCFALGAVIVYRIAGGNKKNK